jgi:20S proteasome alpha/beta subunit
VKFAGSAIMPGQFGPYAAVGAEQTAGGYEIAWKALQGDQYSIWNTDSNGNYLSYTLMAGTSTALEALEPSFHQDLNGDGIIGNQIETAGSTSLMMFGNNFYLYNGGAGPSVKFAGSAIMPGQFGPYAAVGAEQTAGGYEIAWKALQGEQYSIWNTDSNGNYLSYTLMAGTSTALQALEPSFHQDLNGDGVIGNLIEAFGATSLTQVANNFYLYSGGSGPSLKFFGADFTAAQAGAFVPLGAEQIASGYEVAWKNPGTGQYSIWNTDSNGNYLSYSLMSGTDAALKSLESTFHQDLNGDGVIGGSPVILDLDGNGIDIVPLGASSASFDMDGQTGREHTAWVGINDGLLALDLGADGRSGPDGVIDQSREIVFTQWSPGATSDMAALREVFDTNHNGTLDQGDARWSEFRIWQDANGDGISQSGEVKTLDALGIASIGLDPAGPSQGFSDGSSIRGLASFTRTNGTTGAAGDVSLAYQGEQIAPADRMQAFHFDGITGSSGTTDAAISPAQPGLPAIYQSLFHDQPLSAAGSPAPAFSDILWRDDSMVPSLDIQQIGPAHVFANIPADWHIA